MSYIGDFRTNDILNTKFTTVNTSGVPTAFTGAPILACYKNNSTTQSTAGITVTTDFDSITGLHNILIDLSQDGTFYADGSDFDVVVLAGTISAASIAGYAISSFSIAHRSQLIPTVKGRTLDVSSGGEAGIDWANIGTPTATQNLSGTSISVWGLGTQAKLDVNAEVDTALADYDAPTSAELVSEINSVQSDIAALNDLSAAEVNAEVVDVLTVDTFAQPGQENPAATTSLMNMIRYLYKAFRNKITQDSTTLKLYADDGTTVDQKATTSDNGTTYTRGEIGTGP